jgi:hypothetical protein
LVEMNWVEIIGASATNQIVVPISQANDSIFYRLVYP